MWIFQSDNKVTGTTVFSLNDKSVFHLLTMFVLGRLSTGEQFKWNVKCDKKQGRRTDLSIKRHKQFVFGSTLTAKMAGQSYFGVWEVYTWLSSMSHGLNLERLAPEFERRGFQSMHSLKYIGQNDLEVIINYPDKLLLAEKNSRERARGDKEAVSTAQGTFSISLHWVSASC